MTHETGFARRVADRVVIMEGGRIVAAGGPEAVLGPAAEDMPQFRGLEAIATALPAEPAGSR